jgi:hypothetical protein
MKAHLIERNSEQFFIKLIPREIALRYYVPHCHFIPSATTKRRKSACFEGSGDGTQRRRAMLDSCPRLVHSIQLQIRRSAPDVLELLWTEFPKTKSELSVDLIINEP